MRGRLRELAPVRVVEETQLARDHRVHLQPGCFECIRAMERGTSVLAHDGERASREVRAGHVEDARVRREPWVVAGVLETLAQGVERVIGERLVFASDLP